MIVTPILVHLSVIHSTCNWELLKIVKSFTDTVVSEQGRLIPSDKGYVLEISGQYQFRGDDGNIYVTKYRGGPDGFHVDGAHLPHNVPVPAIA